MSTYRYDRIDLSTDAIRLLLLTRGYHTDPIRCQLFEAFPHAEEGVPYEALSYTWGDTSNKVPIFLNDKVLHVTSNLYTALNCLRSDVEDRVLWVDAICIDQDHLQERNHQVGQMKLIYENAKNVIIWLGSGSQEIDVLFDMIDKLDKRGGRDSRRASVEMWKQHWSALLKESGGPTAPLYQVRRQALEGLLARSWFERIWVIQEAWSARRAIVACGWRSVAARAFALTPSFMGLETGSRPRALLEAMPGPLRAETWQAEAPDLCTVLRTFGDSKSSDERDQIYALLGISSDASRDGVLRPRYDLPMNATLRDTISYLVFGTILDDSFRFPFWFLTGLRLKLHQLPEELLRWALADRSDELATRLATDDRINMGVFTIDGQPVLHDMAANHGSVTIASLIVAREDVDVNLSIGGRPALHEAVRSDHMALIDMLSKTERLVGDTRDGNGLTALEVAAKAGSCAIVELLLANRPVTSDLDPWDMANSPNPPLTLAAEGNHVDCLKVLLATGAQPEVIDLRGRTALWEAASQGHASAARVLLENGADAQTRDPFHKRTALFVAAAGGHLDVARLLIDKGAALDEAGADPVLTGLMTALGAAAWRGHHDVVSLLLERGADADARPPVTGMTALWLAARRGRTECARRLLAHGAGTEVTDFYYRCTPLWIAAQNGHAAALRLLLDHGAATEPKDAQYQATALWIAAREARPRVVELLVERGADLEARGVGYTARAAGSTPLLVALMPVHDDVGRCEEVVRFLLDRGADVAARNDLGMTACAYVKPNMSSDIKQALKVGDGSTDAGGGRDASGMDWQP